MSRVKGKSGLFIPEFSGKTTNQVTISLEGLKKWHLNLPHINLSEKAKALYVVLQDSHQTPLPINKRLEILEFLKPTLNYLSQALQTFYARQETLSDSQFLEIDLIYCLHFEMINGYKLVMEDIENAYLPHRKLLLSALQNAMHYSSMILFNSYLQHRTPPNGSWQELHQLFHFATRKKLTDKTLPNILEGGAELRTLDQVYKHNLLFSICSPFRLRKDEILHLNYAAQTWAKFVVLQKEMDEHSSPFIVNVTQDSAPLNGLYVAAPAGCLYIGLEKIIDRLERLSDAVKVLYLQDNHTDKEFSPQEITLSLEMISDLIALWKPRGTPKHRFKKEGSILVCLGISATHWYLNPLSITNPSPVSLRSTNETSNTIYIENLPGQMPYHHVQTKHPLYICELVDVSDEGYCLKWLQDVPYQLQCGGIIAFPQEGKKDEHWIIGTIRWIRTEENNDILVGIKIVSRNAFSVKVNLPNSTTESVSSLLLDELPGTEKPITLLTPQVFKSEQDVEIIFQGKKYNAVLEKNYSASPCYDEFSLDFSPKEFILPKMNS